MFLFSRAHSRSQQPTPEDSPPGDQDNGDISEPPASDSPADMSRDSEGYPSWLPQRPPPPAPASTFASSNGGHEPPPPPIPSPMLGGRKPTPRSVRIVSMEQREAEKAREPSGPFNNHRVWSKATGTTFTPPNPRLPQPRFRSRGANFDFTRNPSFKCKLYFYLSYLFLFAHIPLQTFFDFNAVFILVQVSKFPNPVSPGVPGSGRNWALGAAAYVASWLAWILVVCIVYELVYSFVRRWRTKRPAIYPIYMSSSAFTFASLTSYSNFCFLQHIRYTAFFGEHGGVRDGLAETFWFYSQNLPTVALLLPRGGLSLALLFSFSSSVPGVVALADAGISFRDATYFRPDGALTDFARGVLIANAAWTLWKILVLTTSWIGLWVVSGQGCAGLCGPRYRWEEEDAEKTISSIYSIDNLSEREQPLPWVWKENTRMRILDAYDLVAARPSSRGKKSPDMSELLGAAYPLPMPASPGGFEGMDRLMAAVGIPLEAHGAQSRRGILSDELFQQPEAGPSGTKGGYEAPQDFASVIPKVVQRTSRDRELGKSSSAPLMKLPYPFTAPGAAQVSSEDERIPFPPSPSVPSFKESSSGRKSQSRNHGTTEGEADEEDEDDGEEDEEDDEEEEEEEEEEESGVNTSEDPSASSGRASGSMSSLGHPVSSRYPFQFRQPTRGASVSSGVPSHATPPSNGHSVASRFSQGTRSTGNRESTDSHSPRSHYTASGSDAASPMSMAGLGLPMPPRHPQQYQGRGRARAGTVPVPSVPSSPSIDFPRRARARPRTSDPYNASSPEPAVYSSDIEHDDNDVEDESRVEDSIMEQPEPEGSQEAAEGEDVVGLLSPSNLSSPRTSFIGVRHRASTLSSHHRRSFGTGSGSGSRSGSNSRANSHSGSSSSSSRSRAGSISVAMSVRSRAQSLMQNVSTASRSSLDLVQDAIRLRANSSMARLEEDSPYSSDRTHSRSGSASDGVMSSSHENYTFGQPVRIQQRQNQAGLAEEEDAPASTTARTSPSVPPVFTSPHSAAPDVREAQSHQSLAASSLFAPSEAAPPSLHPSETTMHQELRSEPSGLTIPIPAGGERSTGSDSTSMLSSHPDISTAAPSFITASATIEGATTEESGRTPPGWSGGITHMVDRSDGTWRPA